MNTLREASALEDISRLAALWHSNSSFLFVPDNNRAERAWLARVTQYIPEPFHTGCFGLLTSGSTGDPKLIIGSKNRTMALARLLHKIQNSDPVKETVCALPFSYSYSFVNQWLWALLESRSLRITPGFSNPEAILFSLKSANDAMLCLVGTQVALIRRYFSENVFPGIIRLHFAGGRFPQEQLEFLGRIFPNAQIYNNYGCAEAMPRLTLRRAEEADSANNIGRTLPGVEIRADGENRLLFRSPYRAVAFIDESGFHEINDDEWLPTGDLGEQNDDGSWRLLGRASDVFKRFGEKISLSSVLTTIKSIWDGDAAFYMEYDPTGEQGAVLVLSPEPDEVQLRSILMALRKNHRRPHWPLRIESQDAMPILPNGKTDTRTLAKAQNKKLHWRQRI